MPMKIRLKIFLIILSVFVFSVHALAAEWIFITDMEGRKHYIDKESINDESGFKWSYYKSVYPDEQTGNDFATKKTYSYISAVSYMAFNCSERTLVPLSTSYLNDHNIVVHKIRYTNEKEIINGEKTWELDDNPETFRASIISYVCK